MINKYPGEMIDPKLLEQHKEDLNKLDKPDLFDLTSVTATPGATAESQGWDENTDAAYLYGKKVEIGTIPETIEDPLGYGDYDGDVLSLVLVNEPVGLLHPTGKTNYAAHIFNEAIAAPISATTPEEQISFIYTTKVLEETDVVMLKLCILYYRLNLLVRT